MTDPARVEALRAAAQAVVERWDTPLWKDVPATANYINRLRAALQGNTPAADAEPRRRGSALEAPVGELGRFEMFDYPDDCSRPRWVPAAPAENQQPLTDEAELRRMLCAHYSGAMAYMDDGEAQDNREQPLIDFRRDSVAEIKRKMAVRAANAAWAKAQEGASTPAEPMLWIRVFGPIHQRMMEVIGGDWDELPDGRHALYAAPSPATPASERGGGDHGRRPDRVDGRAPLDDRRQHRRQGQVRPRHPRHRQEGAMT